MSRNFWLSCPKQLNQFPKKACPLGHAGVNTPRLEGATICAWYINSVQDHYCFWKLVRRRSNTEGYMPPMKQSDIKQLTNLSNTKLSQTVKSAFEKLEKLVEYQDLEDLLD